MNEFDNIKKMIAIDCKHYECNGNEVFEFCAHESAECGILSCDDGKCPHYSFHPASIAKISDGIPIRRSREFLSLWRVIVISGVGGLVLYGLVFMLLSLRWPLW